MKYIFCLFSVVLFSKGCNDAKTETTKSAQDDISITYEASSRGLYQKIDLSKAQITVANDRSGTTVTKECNEADWSEVVALLDKIDAEKLNGTTVKDEDIARDAAIPATLTIKYKDNTITSKTIAHGNPPSYLAPLLTKIQAMAKAVDKP
ncbi:hypothetical protein H2O64_06835 [Kordia sp. YSTF-M3]|uniref:Lipoprotein n=1 Tax=Kordia aestuariivivens TaxID=2759037 RepID=A0ABR7Q752_9FLAO|nr:hypothetical protein [Kordia aestuariivivens]MBC8754380.1 hypothetical protein [Kordia aestuariivivens]